MGFIGFVSAFIGPISKDQWLPALTIQVSQLDVL